MPPRGQGRRTTSSRAIFLVLCTGLLLTRRDRLPARRQKLDQSLGDGQAVRWLRSTDGRPSEHRRERLSRHDLRAMRRCRGTGSRVVRIGGALPACCRRMVPSTRFQDFACAACPESAVARAFSRATVAASLPCTSIMSLARFKSSESSIIMVASSITVLNAGGESGRGDRPSRLYGEAMPFPPRLGSSRLSNPCRPAA